MPNRYIRESILDSEKVCSLPWAAEVFYRRLMSVVDDYGRFDGRASVLRVRLYPLQIESVSESDVSSWIAKCERAGLIRLYYVAGKPYIELFNFGQAIRSASKWPDDGKCAHLRAPAPVFESVSGIESVPVPAPPRGGGKKGRASPAESVAAEATRIAKAGSR